MTAPYWLDDETALDFLYEQYLAQDERHEAALDEQGRHLPLNMSPHVALVEVYGMCPRDPERYVAPEEEAA